MEIKEAKKTRVVYVCGGSADVGELTDRAARQMKREGLASMSCLAGIGARDPNMMFNAEYATRVLLMDGCPKACSRRTFQHANLNRFVHFDMSAVGLCKGQSPVTEHNIQRVVNHAMALLNANDSPHAPEMQH